jgi:hypothetical protein
MVVVTEHRRGFEPDCMVIDWSSKLEVQKGMGYPGSSNRGNEVQGEVDLAMGTIFCGKWPKELSLVLIIHHWFWVR